MATTHRLPEAVTDIPARQQKPAAYVPTYATAVSAAEQQERLAVLERVPTSHVINYSHNHIKR
jgi:hypothetical protein